MSDETMIELAEMLSREREAVKREIAASDPHAALADFKRRLRDLATLRCRRMEAAELDANHIMVELLHMLFGQNRVDDGVALVRAGHDRYLTMSIGQNMTDDRSRHLVSSALRRLAAQEKTPPGVLVLNASYPRDSEAVQSYADALRTVTFGCTPAAAVEHLFHRKPQQRITLHATISLAALGSCYRHGRQPDGAAAEGVFCVEPLRRLSPRTFLFGQPYTSTASLQHWRDALTTRHLPVDCPEPEHDRGQQLEYELRYGDLHADMQALLADLETMLADPDLLGKPV